MRTALVHDWLTGMRGGERVLESLLDLFPEAPIYTLLHVPRAMSEKIEKRRIYTSFLQRAPMIARHYRNYLPFFPAAVERFNMDAFDLIISSSHCVAKGVFPRNGALHICYCHTPMRYIWSHYRDYFGDHSVGYLRRNTMPLIVDRLREWDIRSSDRVHYFVANSKTVAGRIKKYYGRDSEVIYPPVDVDFFTPSDEERPAAAGATNRESFFLIVSALVPYKKIGMAIEAFEGSSRRLKIVGIGPEEKRLRKIASNSVEFLGKVDKETLRSLYRSAAALIQPGEEDFGINMVEAMACQCPVIAFELGGACEIVTNGETGLFFNDLTPNSLRESVDKFMSLRFNNALMRDTALRFSPERFKAEFQTLVREKLQIKENGKSQK
jgi:glycosyltransferase involved in cell wall biosynthesis